MCKNCDGRKNNSEIEMDDEGYCPFCRDYISL